MSKEEMIKLVTITSPQILITMLKHKTYSFERLEVWHEIRRLVKKIYQITKLFPKEEKYGLVSQMRNAAVSVSNNICEGTSRISMRDQARFTEISFSSLMELLNELIVSFDLEYVNEEMLMETRNEIDSISNKLTQLRFSQLKRLKPLNK